MRRVLDVLGLGAEADAVDAQVAVAELLRVGEDVCAARARAERELGVLRGESWGVMECRMREAGYGEDAVKAARCVWQQEPRTLCSAVGIEVIGAANPYGCNQYGEGWAEEHDGNSTKYEVTGFSGKKSKMLINKQGGNTVEVATKEKKVGKDAYPDASEKGLKKAADEGERASDEKLKEKEQGGDKISGAVVHAGLSAKFGKEVADKFEQQVKAAPEWVRGFYTKHIAEAVKKIEVTKGISNQCGGNININAHALKEKDWRAENGVLFHEIAHALDYRVMMANKDYDWKGSYPSRVLHDTIKEDYDELVKRFNDKAVERANGLVAEHGGVFSKELFEAAYKAGDIGNFSYKWYKDNPKIEHLPTAYLIALGEKDYTGKKPKMHKSSGAWHLRKEICAKPRVMGAVCDAFNFKNGAEYNVGHDKSYYKKWGSKADAMETFANLFALYAADDKKTIEEVEKYLPRTCKRFKEFVKDNS